MTSIFENKDLKSASDKYLSLTSVLIGGKNVAVIILKLFT